MHANRFLLINLLLGYLVFVVYGSLVPFDYTPKPWPAVVDGFMNMPMSTYSGYSRTDWATNILLFIPLAYLAMAAASVRGIAGKVLLSLLLLAIATMLSASIELVQQYFPPRATGLNDIIAETLGAAIGILLWWITGRQFARRLALWRQGHSMLRVAEQLFLAYVALLLLYSVLPLDLTISPVELYKKWSAGRITLIPFSTPYGGLAEAIYASLVDLLIWLPAGAMIAYAGGRLARRPVLVVFLASAGIELAQLFVASRFTDITDVILATLGGFLGSLLVRQFVSSPVGAQRRDTGGNRGGLLPVLAMAGWMLLLVVVFWYPFDIAMDRALINQRIDGFIELPLQTLFFGTEYNAVTQLVRKTLWFAPLGLLFAWWRNRAGAGPGWHWPDWLIALAIAGGVCAVELGQILMPNKAANSSDILIAAFGVLCGALIGRRLMQVRQTPVNTPSPASGAAADPTPYEQLHAAYAGLQEKGQARPETGQSEGRQYSGEHGAPVGGYLLGLALTIGLLWLTTSSELAPYNLRELTGRFPPPVGAIGLMLAAMAAFAPAALVGRILIEARRLPVWLIPALMLGHVFVLFLLLRLVVPLESINDIIGSVRPSATAELERLLRFSGFFLFVGTALSGGAAAWYALRSVQPQRITRWVILLALGFSIGYWAIVLQASTDNLIELVRGRGSLLGMTALCLWLWLTAFHAVLGVQLLNRRLSVLGFLASSLFLLPLAYGLFWTAMEPHLVKYQKAFSAMQFLLSPDRDNYVAGAELLLRFGAMQLGLLLLMGFAFTAALRPKQLSWLPVR